MNRGFCHCANDKINWTQVKKKKKNRIRSDRNLELNKVFFWYPLSWLLLSPMCKCDLSLSHACLTQSVWFLFLICLTATFLYWFLLFFVVCVFSCSMSPDGWLWPSVACSLSCLSLNIARQSAGPWASRSTKVMLTHSPPIMTPPPFSLFHLLSFHPSCSKANTVHRSPTSTLCPFHGSAESGVWATSTCEGIQIQSLNFRLTNHLNRLPL